MNDDTLANLTALGESFTTEFKRSFQSSLGAEICAFANAAGGVILLGVTDKGDIVGIANHNRLKSQVQSTARSAEPPIAVEVDSIGDAGCPPGCGRRILASRACRGTFCCSECSIAWGWWSRSAAGSGAFARSAVTTG